MKTSCRLIAVFSLVGFLAAATASAADGWKMPNLNPFKSASTTRTSASVSDQAKKSSFPKLSLPGLASSKPKARTQPSTWDKMTQGTKHMVTKTKQVLWPWGNSSKSSTSKKKSSSSWFGSWFGKKEPEPTRQSRSVTDFLARERVPY